MLQSTYMATHSSFFGKSLFWLVFESLLTLRSHGVSC
jgi:hypothetical protein